MTKLIMLIGLPGSGKSTYAQSLLNTHENIKYCSSDKIREELYGDESIQGDSNKVFRILHNRVKEFILSGHDVIYDATNVTRKNRKSIINEVKHLDCIIEGHVVWAPVESCLQRDAIRKRNVGESIIRKFLLRWQSPYYDEGFHVIKIIYNVDVGFDSYIYMSELFNKMHISHDNPHHRLDIFDHCLAARLYAERCFDDSSLIQAALFHDIGKPITKSYKMTSDGILEDVAHYYQHECAGGYLTYGCYSLNEQEEAIWVSYLVNNHMEPYFNSKYYQQLPIHIRTSIDQLHEADVAAH